MAWSGYSETGRGSQERGPGSFANDAPRAVQGQASDRAGSAQVRGGVRFIGNGTGDVGRIAPVERAVVPLTTVQGDRTLDTIIGLGLKALAPKIEAIKQRAEVEGAVRQASGVALQEIVNEQPWYATVFGEAPAVEGARAYAVRAGTSEFVTKHLENMDQLAAMPPEEVTDYLMGHLKSQTTGDAPADAQLRGEVVSQMPLLVKAHTKAHVGYMQAKANEASYRDMVAGAEKYGALAGNLDVSDADKAQARDHLVQSFMLPAGRNPSTHWENIGKAVVDQAVKGNSQFLSAAMAGGIVDALPHEQQTLVLDALRRNAPRIFSKALSKQPALMEALAAHSVHPDDDIMATLAHTESVNNIMAEATGIPRALADMLGSDDVVRSRTQAFQDAEREGRVASNAALRAAQKEQATLQKDIDRERRLTLFTHGLIKGFDNPSVSAKVASEGLARAFGLTTKEANEGVERVIGPLDAGQLGMVIGKMPVETFPAIQDRLKQWEHGTRRTDDREVWENSWSQLMTVAAGVPSDAALGLHMGEDMAADVRRVQGMVSNGTPLLGAITAVQAEGPARRAAQRLQNDTTKSGVAARGVIEEAVRKSVGDTGSFRAWYDITGGREPDELQIQVLSGLVAATSSNAMSQPEDNHRVTLSRLKQAGSITLGGGGFTMNMDPQDAVERPLYKALGFDSPGMSNSVQEALMIEVEAQLSERGYGQFERAVDTVGRVARTINPFSVGQSPKLTGFKASGYTVVRLPADDSGDITHLVNYSQDGVQRTLVIPLQKVRDRFKSVSHIARNSPTGNAGASVPSIMDPAGSLDTSVNAVSP